MKMTFLKYHIHKLLKKGLTRLLFPPRRDLQKKRVIVPGGLTKSYFAPRTTPGSQPTIKSVLAGDIGKMELVASLANRASLITKFVYNHGFLLAWLRKREGWTEIIRPGPTRFATTFIALKSIHQHQHDLQALVTSKTFVESRYYRDHKARDFIAAVLDSRFWNDVEIIVRIVAPLIRLLRIVDGDDRPSLAYVYDGMFRAKKAIKRTFMNKKSLYKPYTRIIKQGWDKHLRQKLHAAAYVLNPAFFYDNENMSHKPEVMAGFLDVLTTQVDGNQTDFLSETELYREKVGDFGRLLALKSAKTMRPDMWWKTFGNSAPNVKSWAIKILSQTASSSGCERNWSVFERIHTKKRNRLEHQRLNDLVFVHYNLRLKNRVFNKNRAYDPIDYESIDDIEFWIMEEDANTIPILDTNEMENILYMGESIPIIGSDKEGEEALNKGVEEEGLNLDSFPQENVNSYNGANDPQNAHG
ncbi:uncharacterized protein LOC131630946 isoform X2 [Vicia villosa]|uniref:uncharacterized protein LOC131630946 isoform X2 n=1 Tax=Vicia villosa TaxID=3911 RepID=UPI00273B6A49|nr:uncharacterized protein LOC131630946 isoform X2 [Vicia villosa]